MSVWVKCVKVLDEGGRVGYALRGFELREGFGEVALLSKRVNARFGGVGDIVFARLGGRELREGLTRAIKTKV